MIRITDIKLPVEEGCDKLIKKAASLLKVRENDILSLTIAKRSLDARRKPQLFYVYAVDVTCRRSPGKQVISKHNNITSTNEPDYSFPAAGTESLRQPIAVIGSGPAGLFAAYALAKNGYRPLILERGDEVTERTRKVNALWDSGIPAPNSNPQFGEGGAGTFSDGKLNTSVRDPSGRKTFVLKTFVDFGAADEILYDQKPHLGTDALIPILIAMRKQIEGMGGQYLFRHQVTDLVTEDGRLTGVICNDNVKLPVQAAILAIGHSARDTFRMLNRLRIPLEAKPFAAGLRIEHPQTMIDLDQYGQERGQILPPSSYKLTYQTANGRGVYSFCMCPGGYVINASSEPGYLCVNGMSYQKRDSMNANSALIVTVTPDDFAPYADGENNGPLSGLAFQRFLERAAFEAAGGAIPSQLYGDFREGRPSAAYGDIHPCHKGSTDLCRLDDRLPAFMTEALKEALPAFGRKIRGFDRSDALFSGIEARTSSPVRITRSQSGQSTLDGLYPAGEGAGYAGGIMSAAMDGLRAAESVMLRYAPLSPKT